MILLVVAAISSRSVGVDAHRQRLAELLIDGASVSTTARTTSMPVSGATPIVRWIDVDSSDRAECIQPRGRYSASPAESTVSMTGRRATASAIASRCSVHGCDGSGMRRGQARAPSSASARRPAGRRRRGRRSADRIRGCRRGDVRVGLHRMTQIVDHAGRSRSTAATAGAVPEGQSLRQRRTRPAPWPSRPGLASRRRSRPDRDSSLWPTGRRPWPSG